MVKASEILKSGIGIIVSHMPEKMDSAEGIEEEEGKQGDCHIQQGWQALQEENRHEP